jgi:uncharacterized protein (DUF608 family)
LRTVGAGALAKASMQLPAWAGPPDNPNFDVNIPADKRLNPGWVKALFERGTPEVYSKRQLDNVAMPIGGICAGQVSLSGDARLVQWGVIENPQEIQQGFALRIVSGGKTETHPLTREAFPDLTFRGEYPIAKIDYRHAALPVETKLEAFSPFIPLDAADSGLPATIFHFTLRNTSDQPVEATLAGALENGIYACTRYILAGTRRNQITRGPDLTVLNCTAALGRPDIKEPAPRPDVLFEEWAKETFAGWTVEGAAFGRGPFSRAAAEKYLGSVGGEGSRLVSSYVPSQKETATGKLTSAPFTISRHYIHMWVGGGSERDKIGVRLLVDGKPMETQTATNDEALSPHFFDVRDLQGKQGTLEIFDFADDAHITIGRVTFSDIPAKEVKDPNLSDYGTMALALLGVPAELGMARGSIGFEGDPGDDVSVPLSKTLIGTLGRTVQLKPGQSAEMTFVVTWHFPNLTLDQLGSVGRHYATRFDSADAVARHVATNFDRLAVSTRLWRDTWYDSTLPYWFLDRTFLNTSTLATNGCYRFANGRFYAWEGGSPGCCPGTCTHVWSYAHAMGRLFPELERDTRERVDLGIALIPVTGVIGYRAEFDMTVAIDGQAGTILRIHREHQMAPDDSFLKRNWNKIKLAYTPLFALDPREEGVLDGPQANTLNRVWYGQNAWMSSMYCAAVRAGEQMAREMGDPEFGQKCRTIAEAGFRNIPARLFNGEYFFSKLDPKHLNTLNSGDGSYIDQVYGQSTAFQLGLPRVLPEKETRSALASLWKYNFSPDAGAYFAAKKTGRKFVNPGDAGLIMCTFPRTDWDYVKACGGDAGPNSFAYYFVETWTGNEYQVAAHMLWENMLVEGLAIVRAIHERYGPLRRNPWNEIECGDHYSRAMASHGVFVAACGFEFHGPQGHIGFAPRLSPENFRGAFIGSEGWGTYAQTLAPGKMAASLELKSGRLKLQTMNLTMDIAAKKSLSVKAMLGNNSIAAAGSIVDGRVQIKFTGGITIPTGEKLSLEIA